MRTCVDMTSLSMPFRECLHLLAKFDVFQAVRDVTEAIFILLGSLDKSLLDVQSPVTPPILLPHLPGKSFERPLTAI